MRYTAEQLWAAYEDGQNLRAFVVQGAIDEWTAVNGPWPQEPYNQYDIDIYAEGDGTLVAQVLAPYPPAR